MTDLSRCPKPPLAHQVVGVEHLTTYDDPDTGRLYPGISGLFDEMGAGKTKQVIDAAQVLFEQRVVDQVIVVAPAAVRSVWFDPDFGELRAHLWPGLPAEVVEYHAQSRRWTTGEGDRRLRWTITNYDFIRQPARLRPLLARCGSRTALVLDESSAVKNHRARQTRACLELRRRCGWCWLLNGTPVANNPGDMYAQGLLLDPRILGCSSYFHFRARYAILGGWQQKQVVGWRDLDDLQRRFKPYVIRRLKADCLDLPEKLPPVTLTVPLSVETWAVYREMRDQMVAWLDRQNASVAPQAAVKSLRLSQLTSGFLGGVNEQAVGAPEGRPDFLNDLGDPEEAGQGGQPYPDESGSPEGTRELSREKLDLLLAWWHGRLEVEPDLKLLVWCRFRPELFRLCRELEGSNCQVSAIVGGQRREEREHALRLLDPRTAPPGPVVVVGTPQTGALGLNLTASHTVVYLSHDYSLKIMLQSQDRVHRPGQTSKVWYGDVVATGPQGQKTIDHTVLKALRTKQDLATWTTSAWVQSLKEE